MSTKKEYILITGGAGYIGSTLTKQLVNLGYRIRIFDTFYFGSRPLQDFKERVEIIKGDIRVPPENLFQDITTVIHLAGLSNDPMAEFNPLLNEAINTHATKKLASLAKSCGVGRFIFASSCSIYDMGLLNGKIVKNEDSPVNPRSAYSRSKHQAEKELLKLKGDDFCVIILRMGTVYGLSPRMRYDLIVNTMVKDALYSHVIRVYCGGLQWRPLLALTDACNAYEKAIKIPSHGVNGSILNIATDNYLVKDVSLLIQKTLQKHLSIHARIDFNPNDHTDRSYQVAYDKAKQILFFTPRASLESAIVEIAESILQKGRQSVYHPIYNNIAWMKRIMKKHNNLMEHPVSRYTPHP